MTREVLDTFRAIGSIQRKNGVKAARRYIISFTKSAQNVADVYELARLAFAHEQDVPTLDVIPLFEQVEDLENAVAILDEIIKIPDVQRRLNETGRCLEVMLGYSDSSKDAGPTSATLVLHTAQERIATWAEENNIDLVLMHGRGGAVGRGGGPANRAVLSQPKGSVNCRFKLTEQGEVIFARYGNPTLARRHVESIAGATLLQSAPSVEYVNTETNGKFSDVASALDTYSRERYLDLLNTEGFAEWFSTVTPLTEIGLMPIGSRPAKRGLGAKSLDDLRAIPWIFSWSQARINLAAWYGLGTACEKFADLDRLREAYAEWPLFTTFVDNVEMSLSKTDDRIAEMYLALGDRDDLREKVLDEMRLTRKWVLDITGNDWPLEHRRVLGPVIRTRLPFVNVLSIAQARALKSLREHGESLTPEERERFIYLILCTVSGVAAGLQNTG
jgi:phosphoenolpyruvate carboxylase